MNLRVFPITLDLKHLSWCRPTTILKCSWYFSTPPHPYHHNRHSLLCPRQFWVSSVRLPIIASSVQQATGSGILLLILTVSPSLAPPALIVKIASFSSILSTDLVHFHVVCCKCCWITLLRRALRYFMLQRHYINTCCSTNLYTITQYRKKLFIPWCRC